MTVKSNGCAPVAVVMISLNEAHNMDAVLQNLKGWAQEIFLVDSYSTDETVDIALRHGVTVVQRKFRGFGDQWNFALRELPITAPWTMKLDPDERLSEFLKASIVEQLGMNTDSAICFDRRLWFMGRPIPIRQEVLRIWRTGYCKFSDVSVNEHPLVDSPVVKVKGDLLHFDSPDLHHWVDKQNRYTTAEAMMTTLNHPLSVEPDVFGTRLQRRMWLKQNFNSMPGRYAFLFLYYLIFKGLWRAGWTGVAWVRLRVWVMRLREYKMKEYKLRHIRHSFSFSSEGRPDDRVRQYP
jgi:glycosyltransferase involved in cell wall biosynthesis